MASWTSDMDVSMTEMGAGPSTHPARRISRVGRQAVRDPVLMNPSTGQRSSGPGVLANALQHLGLDLDVMRVAGPPSKTDSPLSVDTYSVAQI
jgi:hypothetical protein